MGKAWLSALPPSWQETLARPTTRDVYSDVLLGVLQRYDVPDLVRALGRRLVVGKPWFLRASHCLFSDAQQL